MKTTQRRMVPVDEESETGKLAAVRDVDFDREAMEREAKDRAESDREGMDREAMDRDQRVPISSADIESETPVPPGDPSTPQGDPATPQGDTATPSFTGAFGNTRRETPRAETPHLADQTSAQAGARWQEILAGFVDDPRRAVGDAHQLVGEVMQRMIDGFTEEREKLERQWSTGGDVSTEDLRVCLQNYRAFFARLLPAADR